MRPMASLMERVDDTAYGARIGGRADSVRPFDWKQPFDAVVHGEPRLTAAANDATAKPGIQAWPIPLPSGNTMDLNTAEISPMRPIWRSC